MGRNVIMHVSHTHKQSHHTQWSGWYLHIRCLWLLTWCVTKSTSWNSWFYGQVVLSNLQLPVAGTLNTGARTLQLLVFLAACKMLASRETERETSPPIRISAVEGQCKLSPIPTRWSQHCSPEHLPSSQLPAIAQTNNPSTTRTLIQVELSQTSRGGIVN